MCTTTNQTKTANPGVGSPSTIQKPAPLPPIQSLQKFLTDAYTTEKPNLEPAGNSIGGFVLRDKAAAISIRAIDSDGNNHCAEINGTKMHFSASLLKVAAMYAAFDLRCFARQYAKDNSFDDQASFLASLLGQIDTSGAVPRLVAFGKGLKPTRDAIFVGFKPDGPNQVRFAPTTFDSNMRKMIIDSNDSAAGSCIRALGYSYINVSLMKEKFFEPSTLNGIWLAGDYSGEGILKSVRVPVENDNVPGGSGEATTTKEMSRMFMLIHTETSLPHVTDLAERNSSNQEMHAILHQTGTWLSLSNSPDTEVRITEAPDFSSHCAKVGIAGLGTGGTGPSVISEGSVVTWNDASQVAAFNTKFKRKLTGDFPFCWQNLYKPDSHVDSLVRVFNTAVTNFLKQ